MTSSESHRTYFRKISQKKEAPRRNKAGADLQGGRNKASPLGRVHRRSSLSRSGDVVCHNFTSDRIKGAARPTRKIHAHELLPEVSRSSSSSRGRGPASQPANPLGCWLDCRCILEHRSSILCGRALPHGAQPI